MSCLQQPGLLTPYLPVSVVSRSFKDSCLSRAGPGYQVLLLIEDPHVGMSPSSQLLQNLTQNPHGTDQVSHGAKHMTHTRTLVGTKAQSFLPVPQGMVGIPNCEAKGACQFSQAIHKAPRPEGGEQWGEGASAALELSAFVPPEAPGGGYPSSSSRVAEFFWCFLLLSTPPKIHEI